MTMTQAARPIFELTLGEVSLKAPETPLYLSLAAQVLEVRRQELQESVPEIAFNLNSSSVSTDSPTLTPTYPSAATQEIVNPVKQPPLIASGNALGTPAPRRARWFVDQFPKIIFHDDSTQAISSLEELKDLIRKSGLQPHPRGDASMLLWQVRNRLGLSVERIDVV